MRLFSLCGLRFDDWWCFFWGITSPGRAETFAEEFSIINHLFRTNLRWIHFTTHTGNSPGLRYAGISSERISYWKVVYFTTVKTVFFQPHTPGNWSFVRQHIIKSRLGACFKLEDKGRHLSFMNALQKAWMPNYWNGSVTSQAKVAFTGASPIPTYKRT